MKNIYLSKNAKDELKNYLTQAGWLLRLIDGSAFINSPIACHPDLYMCKLGVRDDAPVFHGDPVLLSDTYPGDIIFNGACTGKFFIHNLKYTSRGLLKTAEMSGMIPVNTRQGYTKCNLAVIDENSVITSDAGTAGAMEKAGIQVLLIEKGHILLSGYDYGFIGGCCGRTGSEIIFHGDLSSHPDFERIKSFIESKELNLKYFDTFPLEDIGSIIPEITDDVYDR